jgi:hypothetical protein
VHPIKLGSPVIDYATGTTGAFASWASDACAMEAAPELRSSPSGTRVRFDEIMEALRTLDKQANGHSYRRVLHKRDAVRRGGNNRSGAGAPLQ